MEEGTTLAEPCAFHGPLVADYLHGRGRFRNVPNDTLRQLTLRVLTEEEADSYTEGLVTEHCWNEFLHFEREPMELVALFAKLMKSYDVIWLSPRLMFVGRPENFTTFIRNRQILQMALGYRCHGVFQFTESLSPRLGGFVGAEVFSISDEEPSEELVRFFALLARTNFPEVHVGGGILLPHTWDSFFQIVEPVATKLSFSCMRLDADLCRQLATFCRQTSKAKSLVLAYNALADNGAALLEVIAQDQGPTDLVLTKVALDEDVFKDALERTRSLKTLYCSGEEVNILKLCRAVGVNRSLTDLTVLDRRGMSTDTWIECMQRILGHPTLEKVRFVVYADTRPIPPLDLVRRANAVLTSLRRNITLLQLDFESNIVDARPIPPELEEAVDASVLEFQILPRIAENVFRKKVLALEETANTPHDREVLSRALLPHRMTSNNITTMFSVVNMFHDQIDPDRDNR